MHNTWNGMEFNRTTNAKYYLRRVEKLDNMIKNKMIERDQWKSIATGTTAVSDGERVQSSGSQQKMADAVCRYVSIEDEIIRDINKLCSVKQEIVKTIELLPATEYDVLHKVYIQYKSLYDVAADYKKTYSWATTVHGRALKHVQDILDLKDTGKEVMHE